MSGSAGWKGMVADLRELADIIERELPIAEKLVPTATELLDAYVEENGGEMPANDGHPAHKMKSLLEKIKSL